MCQSVSNCSQSKVRLPNKNHQRSPAMLDMKYHCLPDRGGKLARSESSVEWTTMLQQMKTFSANFSPEQVGHSPLACKLTGSSPSGCCCDVFLSLQFAISFTDLQSSCLCAARYVSASVLRCTILMACLFMPQTLDGISVLKCAVERYQPNPSTLTALHADLIQVSLGSCLPSLCC